MRWPGGHVRRGLSGVDHRWRNAPIRTRLTGAAAFAATFAIVAVVAVATGGAEQRHEAPPSGRRVLSRLVAGQ